ncbi:10775_t:CDS:2 [Funneliformis geosporum]|uniref:13073_t:CDS:1 n=1 Tax=Funneliformis geosporum TaxID=1117311 RepID=A0A9W4WX25_9GLOM|nr:10775_t:CDS:2 [Funneliformis geosporum]CAI2178648.1 13073_t:CDS:2 [Funneliformis geosporum]
MSHNVEQPNNPRIPSAIQVPEGNEFKFLLYALGLNVYVCNTTTPEWVFTRAIDTTLINDITKKEMFITKYEVAEHFFLDKPVNGGSAIWKSLVPGDTSFVITVLAADTLSPDGTDNIDWLLLNVTATGGHGAFADNTYILRVNTQKGIPPPASECETDGDEIRSDFLVEYWFYR